jgi:endothelin-converting enzyme/putative endopeptidase
LYKTILDTIGRNKLVTPLKPYLKKIDAVKNNKDLQALLIEMEPLGGLVLEQTLVQMLKTVIEM